MPRIYPLTALEYSSQKDTDYSSVIAPPYDVLDEKSKAALLARNPYNIVKVDLPHLPPKTVGPDEAYEQAATTFHQWIDQGILRKRQTPALYVYQQTYDVQGKTFCRRGLIANVHLQPFGAGSPGQGGIFPHEQTFSAPKADRLKLMKATKAQLSPIFGLYADQRHAVGPLLAQVVAASPDKPTFTATTPHDGVLHEVWAVEDPQQIQNIQEAMAPCDTFIADGHHRYGTALNYQEQCGPFPQGHSANQCLFVLVALEDPGLVVLPTHRVLGSMNHFSFDAFVEASKGKLNITPFEGNLEALEKALADPSQTGGDASGGAEGASGGTHAMGLYFSEHCLAIATPAQADPLATLKPQMSQAWRELDVAILQHLVVENICQPTFCDANAEVVWKFPHDLDEVRQTMTQPEYQLGVIMQPTPLASISAICSSGELMPQKSTFFYPKLATGLVINPLT